MNNVITFINQARNQMEIIGILMDNDCFGYVRNYLIMEHDIDYTDGRFLDEQNVLSLADLKMFITEALKASLN